MNNLAITRKFAEILEVKKGAMYGVEEVTVKTLSNGKVEMYKVFNGTWYSNETPDDLIRVLDSLKRSGTRCRVFYGDRETGYDWCEENDTMGMIGRSTGEVKIPLLIASSRSYGGGSLLDSCIVKIVESNGGRLLWKHPNYQKPEFEIVNRGEAGFPADLPEEYVAAVFRTNDKGGRRNYANFHNRKRAEGYVAFMTGERNSRAYGLEVVKK